MRVLPYLVSALLGVAPAALLAQTTPTPAPAPADVKKEAPKTVPKKVEPKKAEPKKMKVTTVKDGKITTTETTAPPPLKDKDGNLIPTNPDAYDVSSATTPKKKK